MNAAVLADTGPLYALADPDDQYHARAGEELLAIQDAGRQILVLYPILMEAYTLISRCLGLGFAHRWLDSITTGTGLLNPTPDDYAESAATVKTYDDQDITLFDAVVAVVSGKLQIPVWTFDSDFDVMRSNVWRD
jgi:predicted nucleic acid-binding protein